MIKKIFTSPYFAGIFVIVALSIYYISCYICRYFYGVFDVEAVGATEILTYIFYGISFIVAACCFKNYINTQKIRTYYVIMSLWLVALLREMGMQHALTTHDTTVTKLRFFLNPNNPLYEKIISGVIMLLVLYLVSWLVIKYIKYFIKGVIRLKTVPCTIAVMIVLCFFTQIADRFPANYLKNEGIKLSEHITFVLKIFEEGGESLLPLLFAIALLQNRRFEKTNKV